VSLVLRVAALVLFILAAISAFFDGININEFGLIAAGLACWVGSTLVADVR
jgi:hypothetical protein